MLKLSGSAPEQQQWWINFWVMYQVVQTWWKVPVKSWANHPSEFGGEKNRESKKSKQCMSLFDSQIPALTCDAGLWCSLENWVRDGRWRLMCVCVERDAHIVNHYHYIKKVRFTCCLSCPILHTLSRAVGVTWVTQGWKLSGLSPYWEIPCCAIGAAFACFRGPHVVIVVAAFNLYKFLTEMELQVVWVW